LETVIVDKKFMISLAAVSKTISRMLIGKSYAAVFEKIQILARLM